jgi:hypothetical protein
MCPQPGLYVVVASSEEQGRVVASEMLDAAPGAEVKVLVVHEDSSAEDVKELLIRHLTPNPMPLGRRRGEQGVELGCRTLGGDSERQHGQR